MGPGRIHHRGRHRVHRLHRRSADAVRGLPHVVGEEADRLDADPHRPQPGRPARPAAADRRRREAAAEGDRRPDQRGPQPVHPRPDPDDHAGGGGLGGGPLRPRGRVVQRQRRPALPDGADLDLVSIISPIS